VRPKLNAKFGASDFFARRQPANPFRPMIRKAFVMSVHAGHEQEYERRHRPIWPELEKVLRDHGVRSYSIFLHPGTRQLFAYAEIEDEARWAAIAATPATTNANPPPAKP